jgi:two-component sensor histidine kinase
MENYIIEILLGIVIAGHTWWMKTMWSAQKQTELDLIKHKLRIAEEYSTTEEIDVKFTAVQERLNKINDVELLLANQYVKKVDMEKLADSITKRLDTIYTELMNKK